MDAKTGIYRWTSPSGKSYIGQAFNLERRKNEFLRNPFQSVYTSANSGIDNARRKYPNFNEWKYKILEYCDVEDLDKLETHYIAYYDTYNNGYNSTLGGDSTRGFIPSEETRLKLSAAHSGENSYWHGKKLPEEVKEKISASRIGKYRGKDNPNYGKHHTDEVKELLSKIKSKCIIQFTIDGDFVAEYSSAKEASEKLGVCISSISKAAIGKTDTCKGYKWKYK